MVICDPLVSRGGSVERAVHPPRNALHGAVTYADFAGNLEDALTGPQLRLDAFFEDWVVRGRPNFLPASTARFSPAWTRWRASGLIKLSTVRSLRAPAWALTQTVFAGWEIVIAQGASYKRRVRSSTVIWSAAGRTSKCLSVSQLRVLPEQGKGLP